MGREGEIAAGIGQVRSLALLSNLRDIYLLSMTCGPLGFFDAQDFFRNLLALDSFNLLWPGSARQIVLLQDYLALSFMVLTFPVAMAAR